MTDVKKLDSMLDVLKDKPGAKRPKRNGVVLTVLLTPNNYVIQVNGKVLESGQGDAQYAQARAQDRKERIEALGRTVTVEVY